MRTRPGTSAAQTDTESTGGRLGVQQGRNTAGGSPDRVGAGVLSIIGKTPLVRLERVFPDLGRTLYGKLEGLNPGGSVKDRPAIKLLRDALDRGELKEGSLVIESSSGNMGIGLAMACRVLGLRFACVVDVRTTATNLEILRAYGARVELVREPHPETGDYLDARMARIQGLLAEHPGAYWTDQYRNPANTEAHAESTAVELVEDLGRPPDVLLVATSTCGTVSGFQRHFARTGSRTRLVAVDAEGSVLFGRERRKRIIPGLGSAQESELLDPSTLEAVHVSSRECVVGCRLLARTEALLVGGSGGGVVMAARRVAETVPEGADIAMVLPDRGDRYMDTIFSDDWVARHVGDPHTLLDGFDVG